MEEKTGEKKWREKVGGNIQTSQCTRNTGKRRVQERRKKVETEEKKGRQKDEDAYRKTRRKEN